ncbi:thrombospondin type 3 repeat-containing protein [Thermodesulfobacteriota bacterium]
MKKWRILAAALVLTAAGLGSMTTAADAQLIWNSALAFGDGDTYIVPTPGYDSPLKGDTPGPDIVSMAGAQFGLGRALVTASFEGFGNYGNGAAYSGSDGDSIPDLQEYDNLLLVRNSLRWLIGSPDASNPQRILLTGWSFSYHTLLISYMQSLGYIVETGTITQLTSSHALLISSCQSLSSATPAQISQTLNLINGGVSYWSFGHNGPCFFACSAVIENSLVTNFGIEYNIDTVYDPTNNNGRTDYVVYHSFATHPITEGLTEITFDKGSSLVFHNHIPPADQDEDGIRDDIDNCPQDYNPDQSDSDDDGIGDACEAGEECDGLDNDGDGLIDEDFPLLGSACDGADSDVCANGTYICADDGAGVECSPESPADIAELCDGADNDCDGLVDADQANSDGDSDGDACDACPLDPEDDVDSDGLCGNEDNCPATPNPDQADADDDTIGDACDVCPFDPEDDADGDGVCGDVDNCPATPNPDQADADDDGDGDVCDVCPLDPEDDADGDGVCGDVDSCTGSDLGATVVLDDCDTEITNILFDDGCTMNDLTGLCAYYVKNHGQFVSCVAHFTNKWKREGLITGKEKSIIQKCAAKADIP